MNPILLKLIIALAPSIEQLIAAIINKWLKDKKEPGVISAAKVRESAEQLIAISTDPANAVKQRANLDAWAKQLPTPNKDVIP